MTLRFEVTQLTHRERGPAVHSISTGPGQPKQASVQGQAFLFPRAHLCGSTLLFPHHPPYSEGRVGQGIQPQHAGSGAISQIQAAWAHNVPVLLLPRLLTVKPPLVECSFGVGTVLLCAFIPHGAGITFIPISQMRKPRPTYKPRSPGASAQQSQNLDHNSVTSTPAKLRPQHLQMCQKLATVLTHVQLHIPQASPLVLYRLVTL